MKIFKEKQFFYRFVIFIFLLIVGAFTFLRSYYRVLSCDEIIYKFVHGPNFYCGGGLETKLTTFNEVITSQFYHFIHQNGRSIVHSIEQLFTGVIGIEWYYFINAIIFIGLIVCIIKLNATEKCKLNFLLWITTTLILMYLFPQPDSLWYSINLGPNYLIPAFLMTLAFQYFYKISRINNRFILIAIGFLGFIFGWSHEGYSVPVSGALLVYYAFHFNEFKNKGWILSCSIWLGTCIMISSPGYYSRMLYLQETGARNIAYVIELLSQLYSLWLMVVTCIIGIWSKKINLLKLLKDNQLIIISLAFALAFLLVLRPSEIRAFTVVEILSLYISVQVLCKFRVFSDNHHASVLISALLLIFFISTQIVIIHYEVKHSKIQLKAIQQYMASKDGVVCYDPPTTPMWVRRYVRIWPVLTNFSDLQYVEADCGTPEKKMQIYYPNEYSLLTIDSTYETLLHEDSALSPFIYAGYGKYWVDADSVGYKKILLEYQPLDFSYDVNLALKLKFALMGSSYPSKEIVAPTDTIITPNHTYYRIIPPGVRRISAIRLIDYSTDSHLR